MKPAKLAGIHGNPESGNHPDPPPNKVLGKGRGPANRVDVGPTTPQEKTKHLPLAQQEVLTKGSTHRPVWQSIANVRRALNCKARASKRIRIRGMAKIRRA